MVFCGADSKIWVRGWNRAGPAAVGGYQQARLDRLNEIRAESEGHWWLNQYANPANPGSYGSFAAQLVEGVGHIDCLVGTVGSGGSLCGTARLSARVVSGNDDCSGGYLWQRAVRPARGTAQNTRHGQQHPTDESGPFHH